MPVTEVLERQLFCPKSSISTVKVLKITQSQLERPVRKAKPCTTQKLYANNTNQQNIQISHGFDLCNTTNKKQGLIFNGLSKCVNAENHSLYRPRKRKQTD